MSLRKGGRVSVVEVEEVGVMVVMVVVVEKEYVVGGVLFCKE